MSGTSCSSSASESMSRSISESSSWTRSVAETPDARVLRKNLEVVELDLIWAMGIASLSSSEGASNSDSLASDSSRRSRSSSSSWYSSSLSDEGAEMAALRVVAFAFPLPLETDAEGAATEERVDDEAVLCCYRVSGGRKAGMNGGVALAVPRDRGVELTHVYS